LIGRASKAPRHSEIDFFRNQVAGLGLGEDRATYTMASPWHERAAPSHNARHSVVRCFLDSDIGMVQQPVSSTRCGFNQGPKRAGLVSHIDAFCSDRFDELGRCSS
jgi:hypothetical protein